MAPIFHILRSLLSCAVLTYAYNATECYTVSEEFGGSVSESNSAGDSAFRLVQYNVEWLFLHSYNGCPGSSCAWKTQSDAETHMKYVQRIVKDIQPTLMNMCEVEGCYELKDAASGDSTYNPYLIFGKDSSTGQQVGMISRVSPLVPLARSEDRVEYPVSGSTCGYTGGSGTQGVSKHYYTRLRLPNGLYSLLVGVHFLAYPTDKSRCVQREAQAQVIQNIVFNHLLVYPSDEIIVMGDMNDFDGDILDANYNKPISTTLCILKGGCGAHKGEYMLRNVAEKVDTSSRFSDWWDSNGNCISSSNEFSMIDHILVSPNLYGRIRSVEFYHEYEEFCGKYDSDHYPIIVNVE